MKKYLLGAFVFLILVSCSSDDSTDNANNSLLIGTWTGVSSVFNGNNIGVPDSNTVKFTSNNRVEFIYGGFGINGENISEFGSWAKNETTLTITWDDSEAGLEAYVLEVNELTESILKWTTNISGEGTLVETYQR